MQRARGVGQCEPSGSGISQASGHSPSACSSERGLVGLERGHVPAVTGRTPEVGSLGCWGRREAGADKCGRGARRPAWSKRQLTTAVRPDGGWSALPPVPNAPTFGALPVSLTVPLESLYR